MEDKKNEKELKALTRAIMEVLTHNEEIMTLLLDLKTRKVIDSSTLLGLALKVSDLVEVSGTAFSQEELGVRKAGPDPRAAEAKSDQLLAVKEKAVIDGRELSTRETAFQEWTSEQFDEKAWLKKSGLIF
ncbi:MAG: hypothetical protein HZB29_04135 [Nitrospinae bacterium]|nr:hypothetical protein [Nitrospinota bacterium]